MEKRTLVKLLLIPTLTIAILLALSEKKPSTKERKTNYETQENHVPTLRAIPAPENENIGGMFYERKRTNTYARNQPTTTQRENKPAEILKSINSPDGKITYNLIKENDLWKLDFSHSNGNNMVSGLEALGFEQDPAFKWTSNQTGKFTSANYKFSPQDINLILEGKHPHSREALRNLIQLEKENILGKTIYFVEEQTVKYYPHSKAVGQTGKFKEKIFDQNHNLIAEYEIDFYKGGVPKKVK